MPVQDFAGETRIFTEGHSISEETQTGFVVPLTLLQVKVARRNRPRGMDAACGPSWRTTALTWSCRLCQRRPSAGQHPFPRPCGDWGRGDDQVPPCFTFQLGGHAGRWERGVSTASRCNSVSLWTRHMKGRREIFQETAEEASRNVCKCVCSCLCKYRSPIFLRTSLV